MCIAKATLGLEAASVCLSVENRVVARRFARKKIYLRGGQGVEPYGKLYVSFKRSDIP